MVALNVGKHTKFLVICLLNYNFLLYHSSFILLSIQHSPFIWEEQFKLIQKYVMQSAQGSCCWALQEHLFCDS